MIVKKTLSPRAIIEFTGHHVVWLTVWTSSVTTLYCCTRWSWMLIPWLPLTLIGTAVAFYVGFKNNQAYDRVWEARRVWGAIINNSRMLGTMTKHYITAENTSEDEIATIKKRIINRHIAYLYTLREQLLVPTAWEHVSLRHNFGYYGRQRRHRMLEGAYENELRQQSQRQYISENDEASLKSAANRATQLIDLQSAEIAALYKTNCLNMMQQAELQRSLNSFYDEQGKAERIKRFPFPRQYASFSFIFVCIFVFLLPFGMLTQFASLGGNMLWLSIPFGTVISWIYIVMEIIGDYSENPFEGLYNDVPMLSICRTIEIDLLQMMGETDLPAPIQPKNNVLM